MKIAILSVGLLVTGSARADEKKVDVKDLPKPVLAAVKVKFPEAKVAEAAREEEGGKTVYEVAIKVEGGTVDLAVSAKGKILEMERSVEPKKLPQPVKAAVEAKYPEGKIKKAEAVVKYEEDDDDDEDDDEGQKSFEVVVSAPGKEDVEVKLSPKGKVLKDVGEEDEDDKKKDKDDDKDKNGKKKDKDGKKKDKDGKKKDKDDDGEKKD